MAQFLPPVHLSSAVFVFFAICGFYFIVLQMALSHAPDRFLEVHKSSDVPLSITHNILPLLDKILTPLISFFVAAFGNTSSTAYPTVVHFVWSFGCAIQVPLIEAQRIGVYGTKSKRSLAVLALAFPMTWAVLYQRLSGGFIIPIWLAFFMQAKVRAEGAGMEQFKAESAVAGWWIGHTIPALVMLVPGLPALHKAPLWVAFPILMSLGQWGYLFIRRRLAGSHGPSRSDSGYLPAMFLYLSGFIGAFFAHIHLVLIPGFSSASWAAPTEEVSANKLLGLMRFIYKFFVPATGLRIPSPAETTAESGVVHFVQFDVIVVFSALWTALIWDLAIRRATSKTTKMDTFKWVVRTVGWLSLLSLVLSPGAATTLLLMYRETKLVFGQRLLPILPPLTTTNDKTPLLAAARKKQNTYCTSYISILVFGVMLRIDCHETEDQNTAVQARAPLALVKPARYLSSFKICITSSSPPSSLTIFIWIIFHPYSRSHFPSSIGA